jgi:hypothetical protein
MHKNSLLHATVSALLLVGCAGSARIHGSASVSAPELVYISPGVQVIADYREPIFYTDSYYWRYSSNVWYRSSIYTGGWVRYQAPAAIVRIERPSAYVYYRGSAHASTGSTPAMTREERKDARQDAREDRKDVKEAQQEERKEQKAAQQEERKDQKDQKDGAKDAKKDRK